MVSRLQLADIERRANRAAQALALTQVALKDPITNKNPKLLADAHWARACALAGQAPEEAELARTRARQVQEADPQATVTDRLHAEARHAACAGDRESALKFLQEAVANGFRDPVVLVDPTFAALRDTPAFEVLAQAVARTASSSQN